MEKQKGAVPSGRASKEAELPLAVASEANGDDDKAARREAKARADDGGHWRSRRQ